MTRPIRLLSLLLPALLVLSACKRDEPVTQTPPVRTPAPAPAPTPLPAPAPVPAVTIANIELGNAVGADNRVMTPAMAFAPADTIYAAVSTNGAAPSSTITARWTFQDGQVVNESSQTIAPTGPAVTTFNIAKPDGWPAGRYKVEILIDGKSVGQREFDVG
ncbi:MAG TPA: hypothetical protein VND91_10055 [Candidatus Saccharimonadia bacterium]|nr:hypothetical protein [Candidatus Saccharimonadia bacterium]